MGRAAQMAFGERVPEACAAARIENTVARAAAGEPLQYILGYTEFCGHRIEVAPGVLIPRPETEEMTMMIISENSGFTGTVTDICTGSGCMAIAMAMAFPHATVAATELSGAALEMARQNISSNGAAVTLIKSDILNDDPPADTPEQYHRQQSAIYHHAREAMMHRNVLDHEPHEALFVPDDNPLVYYRAIAAVVETRLLPGGTLWLEVNENLAGETAALLSPKNYSEVRVIRDIRGKERFIKAEKYG
ncbi:MAG: N5-glutamine methyltransferase family protein [Bacteroidales bacterium]